VDLKDLRYAVAIAEEGSFTRAAARLNLAQQALSKQIRDLEHELTVRLFVRLPRGARVTAAGARFVEDARRTLAESQRAVARVRSMARGEAQRFRVGLVSCPVLAGTTAAALTCVRRRHTLAAIEVLDLSPMALVSALRDGTIDVAVGTSLPEGDADVTGECVWARPFGAVLPAGHPIAPQEVVQWRDLADLSLITFSRGSDPVAFDALVRALSRRGLEPRIADAQVGGPPSLVGAFIADGEGWTLATAEGSWPFYQRVPGLAFRRFADTPILAEGWILWSREHCSPLVRQFVATWKDLQG
jgi:DNA-binding transcriptional LysR family regulator